MPTTKLTFMRKRWQQQIRMVNGLALIFKRNFETAQLKYFHVKFAVLVLVYVLYSYMSA